MTVCDDIRPKWSALLDRELPPEETQLLEGHLQSCEPCRREWEALRSLDTQLQRLLTLDDVAEKVAKIDQATAMPSTTAQPPTAQSPIALPAKPSGTRGKLLGWTAVIAALAASIVFLLVASRPGEQPRPVEPGTEFAAHLVRATGQIEILSPAATTWTTIDPAQRYEVARGTRVRTGERILCELETSDHSKIRVNESAELILHDAQNLELVTGQLWLLARQRGINVDVPLPDQQENAIATMTCPSGSEIQCEAADAFAACDSVSAQNSPTQLAIGKFSCPVGPGETVSINAQRQIDRKVDAEFSSKVWQLPLLAVGTGFDQELLPSVQSLLAPIGRTKARHFNETQIRQLGPRGAVPLLAYVIAEQSPDQLNLRRTAMQIATDLADESSIHLLQKLTADSDTYISRRAEAALKKIALQAD